MAVDFDCGDPMRGQVFMLKYRALLHAIGCGLVVLSVGGAVCSSARADQIMSQISNSGEIRVGFRRDAFPFAFLDQASGRYAGFSVDMAQLLADFLTKRFQRTIRVRPVHVTAKSRIDMILQKAIDVEMGASTVNQAREAHVDFSLIFFISETTFLVDNSLGIVDLSDLKGKIIGAARGTTNLEVVRQLTASGHLAPRSIVLTDTHFQGLQALQKGTINAYCSDRVLLKVLRAQADHPDQWMVMDSAVAYEPYAFMIPEGNSDFRDFLNDTIRWAVTSGRFDEIYNRWMGPETTCPCKMPPALKEYLQVIVYPMARTWWRPE